MQLTRLKIATLGTPMSFPVWWIPTRQPVGKYADPGTQPGQCLSPASSMQLTRPEIATLGTPRCPPRKQDRNSGQPASQAGGGADSF